LGRYFDPISFVDGGDFEIVPGFYFTTSRFVGFPNPFGFPRLLSSLLQGQSAAKYRSNRELSLFFSRIYLFLTKPID
jgi:hypothetical protein